MDNRLRQLADYFLTLTRSADVKPADISPNLLPHVFILEVEPAAQSGELQLLIRLTGSAIDQAFGRPALKCYLTDFIHGPRTDEVIKAFHRCADSREPLWMRQVVKITRHQAERQESISRIIEAIAIYLEPNRIYGGLIVTETGALVEPGIFESVTLSNPRSGPP